MSPVEEMEQLLRIHRRVAAGWDASQDAYGLGYKDDAGGWRWIIHAPPHVHIDDIDFTRLLAEHFAAVLRLHER